MKLKAFTVKMYRSILNSEQIDLENLTVIVGKNESGKTSLLKALYKFNSKEKYSIDKDWPRGRRKEKHLSVIPCECLFDLDQSEIEKISTLLGSAVSSHQVKISKNYDNDFEFYFDDAFNSAHGALPLTSSEDKKTKGQSDIRAEVTAYLEKRIPTFIYMDDYRTFEGNAQLNQVLDRKTQGTLNDDDKTFLTILELAGLELAAEVKKANSSSKEERQYDLSDASATLTNDISGRWKQRKYGVEFRADGQHFFTFVSDERDPALIELKERSKGFQWFFSFDLMFMHESKGTFKDCILLLDEPGLHLHPDAQRDLLARLESYSDGNTLIYTTHLPFMIDLKKPERIRVLSESREGSKVSMDLTKSQKEAKLVLQSALGMSGSSSYLVAQRNLVVEGVDDYWFVTEICRLADISGKPSIPDDVFITPAGGASEAVYISTFMIGQDLMVITLLDSDKAGFEAKDKLIKNWLTKYKDTKAESIDLAGLIKVSYQDAFSIEDLFGEKYYLEKVNQVYKKQLLAVGVGDYKLKNVGLSISRQVESDFEGLNLHFNKGSVAKIIRKELQGTKNVSDLPEPFKTNAINLANGLNELFAKHEPKVN